MLRTTTVFVGLILLALFTFIPQASACSASCENGSCTGTGTCSCVNGDPVCSDSGPGGDQIGRLSFSPTDQALQDARFQVNMMASSQTPELRRLADLGELVIATVLESDLNAYLQASAAYDRALISLTPASLEVLKDLRPDHPVH